MIVVEEERFMRFLETQGYMRILDAVMMGYELPTDRKAHADGG